MREKATCFQALEHEIQKQLVSRHLSMKSKDGDGVVFRQCEKVEISRKKLRTVRGTRYEMK